MEFYITESQLKYIVESNKSENISDDLKELFEITKTIVNDTLEKYNIDSRLLLTWGAAVGGLVGPLDNFIRNNNFQLTNSEISLILVGVASTIVFDNEKLFKDVLDKIKTEGLEKTFYKILSKGKKLKESFIGFVTSLGVSVTNITALVRYSFLIPIISDIQSLIYSSNNPKEVVARIVERIFYSGVITVSEIILKRIISRIVKRFS
jgi:hypothetical protein